MNHALQQHVLHQACHRYRNLAKASAVMSIKVPHSADSSLPSPLQRWSDVFSATRLPHVYYMKGTRGLCSRSHCRCESHRFWRETVRFLQTEKIREVREGADSPINATTYEYTFRYLDGGFETVGGNHWGGRHGAFVRGISALRFLCYGLGLRPPRRLRNEPQVPTLADLRSLLIRE